MPSIDGIPVKTDWPEEDVNLTLEQINTFIHDCKNTQRKWTRKEKLSSLG